MSGACAYEVMGRVDGVEGTPDTDVLEVESGQPRRVDRLREKSARERVALAGLIQPLDADGEQSDQNCGGLDQAHY